MHPTLNTPTAFRLPWSQHDVGNTCAEVVATQFVEGRPIKWAVREGGNVLAKDGTWELEMQPSSRDADFLTRTRWDSADEAAAAAELFFATAGRRVA